MTAVGVTGYLLYIGEFTLSLISMIVFGKLIIFHFVMDYFDKKIALKLCQYLKNHFYDSSVIIEFLNCNSFLSVIIVNITS